MRSLSKVVIGLLITEISSFMSEEASTAECVYFYDAYIHVSKTVANDLFLSKVTSQHAVRYTL